MMIDPVKMLSDVPGALHVEVADAAGVGHDGVLTYSSETRGAGEYGFPVFDSDTVYVAAPFDCPRASLRITRDGNTTVRKIEGKTDNVVFVAVSLGGELDDR